MSRIYNIKERLQETKVSNELGSIAGLLSILTFLGNIVVFFRSLKLIEEASISWKAFGLMTISLMLVIVWLVVKLKKYRTLQSDIKRVVTEHYRRSLETYRDTEGHLSVMLLDPAFSLEHLTDLVIDEIRIILDELCDTFNLLTEAEVSACIKIFGNNFTDSENISYADATVVTFVRSTNSDSERHDNEISKTPPHVWENTDFKVLCDDKVVNHQSIFYSPNLEAEDNYENSTPHWEQYYKSAAVVPIRIANENYPGNTQVRGYKICGFLCADSIERNVFEERQMKYFKAILQAYAALFYLILHTYDDYIAVLTSSEKGV